jgi:hypothetical protein
LQIQNRLVALTMLGGLSGLLYVPFALMARPEFGPLILLLGLPIGSALVVGLSSWGGLILVDRLGLSMPLLGPWELGQRGDPLEKAWMVRVSAAGGGVFGLAANAAMHVMKVPGNPGSLGVRLAAAPFAAVVPEAVAHLLVMSGLMLLMKQTWIPILLSSAAYAFLLHIPLVGLAGAAAFMVPFNFFFATLTGWLYSRYGIGSAMLAHSVGQAIFLGLN